jgi:hypothetical protein
MRQRHRSWMDAAELGTEVVVEIKGPGQVVGEVVMEDAPPPCRYSARARGDVVALKLTQVRGRGGLGDDPGPRGRGWQGCRQPRGRPSAQPCACRAPLPLCLLLALTHRPRRPPRPPDPPPGELPARAGCDVL